MKSLFALFVAVAVVALSGADASARLFGRNGGGNMGGNMICNANQVAGPVPATAADLQVVQSASVMKAPSTVGAAGQVFVAKKARSGFKSSDIANLGNTSVSKDVAAK